MFVGRAQEKTNLFHTEKHHYPDGVPCPRSCALYRGGQPVLLCCSEGRVSFNAMDNAYAAVKDVPALQTICDDLSPEHIRALLDE